MSQQAKQYTAVRAPSRFLLSLSLISPLVTHGPPYGILDRNYAGRRIGDPDLMKRVRQWFGTTFVNAAIGDDEDPNLSDRVEVIVLYPEEPCIQGRGSSGQLGAALVTSGRSPGS